MQEQAFNCIANIASNTQDIDLLFSNVSGDDLMSLFADALEPMKDNIPCHPIYALANIANGTTAHRMYIVHNERLLANLRGAMTSSRVDVRHAAVSCVESLAKGRHHQLRRPEMENILKSISRGTMSSGLSGALSSSPNPRSDMSDVIEIRELARSALRYLSGE